MQSTVLHYQIYFKGENLDLLKLLTSFFLFMEGQNRHKVLLGLKCVKCNVKRFC